MKELAFHPSWKNAPKSLQNIELYGKYNKDQHVYDKELLIHGIMAASQAMYAEDLDEFEVPEKYSLFKKLLPTLETLEGDVYQLGQALAYFVEQNEHKAKTGSGNSALQESLKEDFKKEVQKLKKDIPGGNKGGSSRDLWAGPKRWPEEWFKEPSRFALNMHTTQVMQNATAQIPKEKIGKPKIRKDLRTARCIDDLKYCGVNQWAMEDDLFWLKYAQGEIQIMVPIKKVTTKQIIIVYLDDSGSMADKKDQITAIFNHLFEQILKGNTIMYFAPFVYHASPLRKVETLEEVNALKADFRCGGGGTTYLNLILPPAIAQIQKGKIDGFEINNRTEMLIINDGQDSIKLFESPIPIHSISVEDVNEDLKDICQYSGGQYFHLRGGTLQLL